MGGSISIYLHSKPKDDIFLHATGKDVYSKFVHEENATHSFAQFVKNGHWLSILSHHDHHASKLVSGTSPTSPKTNSTHWIERNFTIPDSLSETVNEFLIHSKINDSVLSANGSSRKVDEQRSAKSQFSESYQFDPQSAIFSLNEMSAVMCSILFPLYLQSEEYLLWSDSRNNSPTKKNSTLFTDSGKDTVLPDERSEIPDEITGCADMEHMKHILLSTAAFLDESEIVSHFALGRSFEDAENAVACAALGVCILTSGVTMDDCHILYANQAFERTTGYYASQLVGKSLGVLVGEGTEEQASQTLHGVFQEKRSFKLVFTAHRRNRTKCPVALALKPAFDDQGQCVFWVCVCFDLSKRPASLASLKRVEDLLALIPNLLNYTFDKVITTDQ